MKAASAWLILIGILTYPIPARAQWSEPINMGPPVNSATQEYYPSLTLNENMLVMKTGRGYESGLFISRFVDGEWTAPQYIYAVGNPANIMPTLSPDGSEIYFSCYCGGYGDYDIWKTVYDTVSEQWSAPENAGPNINDGGGQIAPFISYDGQKLFFYRFFAAISKRSCGVA